MHFVKAGMWLYLSDCRSGRACVRARACVRMSRLGRSADGLVDAKLRMYVTELTVSSVTELVYSL